MGKMFSNLYVKIYNATFCDIPVKASSFLCIKAQGPTFGILQLFLVNRLILLGL